MSDLSPPDPSEHDWLALATAPIPLVEALSWVSDPGCGAVVLFSGVVRDHADGRPGVSVLEYEAYEEQVVPHLARIAAEARRRWPSLARLVAIHRAGALAVGEVAVVVVVSTEHREAAFEAGRFVIDTIKAEVPIWKLETWEGGRAWSEACSPVGAAPEPGAAGASLRHVDASGSGPEGNGRAPTPAAASPHAAGGAGSTP
ncbi:MAG TPA: molybdenum cofactor biosynthesis protein MoaE [Acidimicrobiales bacterium]|nr:molybdenum cofactor biosynthesis protein MoaE [Acidimicrobiales bacterium]